MAELQARPGFNLDCTFKEHISAVRSVLRNPNTGQFISVDDKTLKSWAVERNGSTKVVHNVAFPGFQSTFLTSIVLARDLNMIFASCLDSNLRLYSDKLQLKAAMPWSNGLVRTMVYNHRRNELITAGSAGVRVWECEMDHEAYRTDKDVNPYEIPRTADGQVIPWCFGKYQNAKQRLSLSIPGVREGPVKTDVPTAVRALTASGLAVVSGDAAKQAAVDVGAGAGSGVWCDKIVLHEAGQTLFVVYQGSIYGYELAEGTLTHKFPDLHKGVHINCMVYLPDQQMMLTSTSDSGGTVWRIAGGQPHKFKQIGSASVIINYMAVDDEGQHLLTAQSDGCVTLWSVDTLLPIYKMKLSKSAVSPCFYSPTRFFLHFDSDIKLFSILNLYQGWMECNSEPVSLKQLSHGLILAEFRDSSVRILDSESVAPDKSAATTVPQLSTHSLVTACCSLPTGRLFTLLSNSHIHLWDVHLKRPPTFAEAWTHLARESCTCMCILDGDLASEKVLKALGIPPVAEGAAGEFLLLGTTSGDCLVSCVNAGGSPLFRFPAFKSQPLQHLALDLDRGLLVACSRSSVRVWTLSSEVKCVYTLDAGAQVTKVDLLEGRAILGTSSGSVLLLDMPTGRTVMSSSSSDHMDAVTGIGTSMYLQHFVTSSQDRNVKVFDRDKTLKRSLYLSNPLSCCCYLNDEGDILLGIGNRLVVVRASKYEFIGGQGNSDEGVSIYEGWRGRGTLPAMLLRADVSRLQSLSSAKLPQYVIDSQKEWERQSSRALEGNHAPATTTAAAALLRQQSPARTASPSNTQALRRSNTLAMAIRQSMGLQGALPADGDATAAQQPQQPPQQQPLLPPTAGARGRPAPGGLSIQGEGQHVPSTTVAPQARPPASNRLHARVTSPPAGALSSDPPPPKTSARTSKAGSSPSKAPSTSGTGTAAGAAGATAAAGVAGAAAGAAGASGTAVGVTAGKDVAKGGSRGGHGEDQDGKGRAAVKSPSVGQGQRGEGKVDSEGELGEGSLRRLQEEGRWGNRWRGKQADGEAGSRKMSAEGPRQGASAGAAAGAGLGDGGDAKELKQVEGVEAAGGQGEEGEEGEEEEGVSGSDAEGEEGSSGSGDSEGSDGSSSSEEGGESDAASPSGRGAAGHGHEGGFDLTPDQRWQRREAEAKQARIHDLLQAFHRSQLYNTRHNVDLTSEQLPAAKRLFGLAALQRAPSPTQMAKEAAKQPVHERGLAAASNVRPDDEGRYVMQVGQLRVELDEHDLKAQRGTVSTLSPGATVSLTQTLAPTGAGPDGAAVSSAGATGYLDDTLILPPLGGQGLSAAFRKALPVICSSSAFLDDEDGMFKELKFKRTKLKQGFKKAKKKKSKQKEDETGPPPGTGLDGGGVLDTLMAKIAAATAGAEEGAMGATKKKKRKKKGKKRRRQLDEAVDPVKQLYKHASLPSIYKELKDYEQHRMLTRQAQPQAQHEAAERRMRGSAIPGGSGAVGAGGARGQGEAPDSASGRHLEPPDAERLLNAYRNGWKPLFREQMEDVVTEQQMELLKDQFLPRMQNLGSMATRLQERAQMQRAAEAEGAERGQAGRLIASVPATLAAQGAAMAASRDALLTRAGSAARSEYGATSQQGDSPHSGAVSESGAARSAGGAARSGGGAGTTSSARAGGGAAQQRTVRVASTAAVVMGSAPAGTAAVVAKVKPRLSQVMTSRQAANPLSKTLAQMGAGIGSALSEGAQLQHGHHTALHRPSPGGRAG